MASEKLLVVGGCGLTGYYVLLDLLRSYANSELSALDTRPPSADRKCENVRYYDCDITNREAVSELMHTICPTVIINVASPRAFIHSLDFCLKVNHGGSRNLIESSAASLKAFVYTSSSSVVHDSVSDMVNFDETARVLFLPEQKEPYHHSKAMAEQYVLGSNRQGDSSLVTCVLRPSGIFGPGDDMTIPNMVQSAKDGKYKVQIGDGKNRFDWTYVENVARAHVLAVDHLLAAHDKPAASIPEGERVDGEAFFITNDEPWPFWDFARAVGAAAGYPTDTAKVRVIPRQFALVIGYVAEWFVWITSLGRRTATFNHRSLAYSTQVRIFNISKAKERLHYKPSISV
ncbi:MAG: hypothetical protein Q9162_007897, partial [Coniocarpon cinnabarinum]